VLIGCPVRFRPAARTHVVSDRVRAAGNALFGAVPLVAFRLAIKAWPTRVMMRTLRLSQADEMTQAELVVRCDSHRSYICDVERGGRNLTLLNIAKLAKALHVSIAVLMKGV
jgi:helix-turn-helix protein